MEGRNSAHTKLHNRRRVLQILRREPVSRAELSRRMGLTRAAISLIADELILEGVLRESSAQVTTPGPGRSPTLLKVCSDAYYAIGVSLSRDGCYVGISDFSGKTICSRKLREVAGQSRQQTVERVAQLAEKLCQQIPKERILGVGVIAPGPVDSQTGTILNPPGFAKWENCPIAPELSKRLKLPVYLENDANAAALYNYMEHDFPGKENFVLVYVEQGVGSGVISGGKLLRSAGGFTCELGHTSIDFRGPVCSCGNRGCLENFASIEALCKHFGADSWEAIMASSDREAALELEAEYLSAALVNLSNVVRPEAVLLGGRMQSCSRELLPRIAKHMENRTLNQGPTTFLAAGKSSNDGIECACGVVFAEFMGVL